MTKEILFSILLIVCSLKMIGQDHPIIDNTYENSIFEKVENSEEVSALELMIALDYKAGDEEYIPMQIEKLYKELDPESLKSKSIKKQIKTVFKKIHESKLKKYVIDADFNQLFERGEYNCVSASALYAQIFNHLGIDYEIRETPTHVYLTADPEGEKFLIETTLPQGGAINFDYKTQKEFVEYLRSSKLISEEEYESTPVSDLFDQHFDTNKAINENQLAALLYYNKGVDKYNLNQYKEASKYLSKAHQIYPSKNIHFLLNYSLINALSKCEIEKKYDPYLLADFININDEKSQFLPIGLEHFALVSQELVVIHPNEIEYDDYFKTLLKMVDENKDLNGYKLEYHQRKAFKNYMNSDIASALMNLKVAYEINPENLQLKETVLSYSAQHMMDDRDHENNIDSLDKYFEYFNFLTENEKVMVYYNYLKMRIIRERFQFGILDEGLVLLDSFEEDLKVDGVNSDVDQNYFAGIYIDLASYYLNKEQVSKALMAIKRGLELDPNSLLLQDRYKTLYELNARFNQSKEWVENTQRQYEASFSENLEKYFQGCWQASGKLNKDNTEGKYDETFRVNVYKGKKISYVSNGKMKDGKFSFRSKSKLLYLTSALNSDDYLVFKVDKINDYDLVLMPFKDDKLTGERIYLNPCR